MSDKELEWFENSVGMTEKLFDFLSVELKEQKPSKEYVLSYAQYIHKSKLSHCGIKLKGIKNFSTDISFYSMLYETDKPYRLSLWKYNGEHFFQDYDLKEINEQDFPTFLTYIKMFFGLISKSGFEQLTLF